MVLERSKGLFIVIETSVDVSDDDLSKLNVAFISVPYILLVIIEYIKNREPFYRQRLSLAVLILILKLGSGLLHAYEQHISSGTRSSSENVPGSYLFLITNLLLAAFIITVVQSISLRSIGKGMFAFAWLTAIFITSIAISNSAYVSNNAQEIKDYLRIGRIITSAFTGITVLLLSTYR